MININFEVSKAFLAYRILTRGMGDGRDKGLRNRMWEINQDLYKK
jgi:hypothetical protein